MRSARPVRWFPRGAVAFPRLPLSRRVASGAVAAWLLASPTPGMADAVARVSVTLHPDKTGALRLPGPFSVFPGGRQAVLYVPASRGLFVLEQQRIVHHLPLPSTFQVESLDSSDQLIVAGSRPQGTHVSVDLLVFDRGAGSTLARVESANPFLRVDAEQGRTWRVVAGKEQVGVFHPPTAATYPLWHRSDGLVPSQEQIGRARSGIGLHDGDRWVPHPDGSVERRVDGRTESALESDHGTFVGALDDGTVLMRVEESADEPSVLPRELVLHAFRDGNAVGKIRLRSRSSSAVGTGHRTVGPPVQLRGNLLYWLYLGHDYLEVRTIDPTVTLSRGG